MYNYVCVCPKTINNYSSKKAQITGLTSYSTFHFLHTAPAINLPYRRGLSSNTYFEFPLKKAKKVCKPFIQHKQ